MKVSTPAVLLAALAAGKSTAAIMEGHTNVKHNHAMRHAEMLQVASESADLAERDLGLNLNLGGVVSAAGAALLGSLNIITSGLNNHGPSGTVPYLGGGGQYTNTFVNEAPHELQLYIWGPAGSWVNAVKPHIVVSIPAGGSQLVSFPSGASGAWSVVDTTTTVVNGQIFNTWGEFTFGQYGVYDVSREVNMHGINMTIVGPSCVSTMDMCVFQCKNNAPTCWYDYQLVNCENGSQKGANKGTYAGADSGGCGGMGDKADLKTYLNSRT